MVGDDTRSLQRRLGRLERRQRRLTLLAMTALLLAAGLLLTAGQAPPEAPAQLTAREFVLVDAGGAPRARLAVAAVGKEADTATLVLLRPDGKPGVALAAAPSGAASVGLGTVRPPVNQRVQRWPNDPAYVRLALDAEGRATLNLQAPGNPSLDLGVGGDGGEVALFGAKNHPQARLSLSAEGASTLRLQDPAAKAALDLGVAVRPPSETPEARITFFSSEGEPSFSLPQ